MAIGKQLQQGGIMVVLFAPTVPVGQAEFALLTAAHSEEQIDGTQTRWIDVNE